MKKTFLAAIILSIFVFTLSSDFFLSDTLIPNVLAEIREDTHLDIERGTVLVNGEIAVNGTLLMEGDSVEVQSGSSANIVFFDNSIARLSGGTKITITEIKGEDSDNTESHVRLKLDLGEAWSKVTKLVNSESTFSVATADVAATVRGSAFNIAVNEAGDTMVMAVEHSLLLEKMKDSGSQKNESVMIIEGQKASSYPRVRRAVASDVESQPGEITEQPSVRFKVEKITRAEKQDSWFRNNKMSDEIHELKIQRKIERVQEELVGALPGSTAYMAKTVRDEILLATAFDVEKHAEIKTKIAERKILEAQVLMRKGEEVVAEESLKKAKELLLQVAETRNELVDPQTKAELNEKITSTISNSKKIANSISASDRDYRAKEFLYEVEILVASENVKEEIKKEQYQHRIIETFDLAKSKNNESVNKVVKKLARDMKTDFIMSGTKKEISEENLNDLMADPYLNAVMRKVGLIEEKHASAEIVDSIEVEVEEEVEVEVEVEEEEKAWLEQKAAEAEYKAAVVRTKDRSEENEENFFFVNDDTGCQEITFCGDGIIQTPNDAGINEDCEFPNTDTCDSNCQTIIQPFCGDGSVNQSWEECELPNTDTCDSGCKTIVQPFCGDGAVNQSSEECELPNTDTCDSDCQTISLPILTYCGDGIIQTPNDDGDHEECELPNTDTCDSDCQIIIQPFCGDGAVNQSSEECELPNTDTCDSNCQEISPPPPTCCGDGTIQTPNDDGFNEECEPSNINTDTCNSDCQIIIQPICGDDDMNQWWEECEPPDTSTCDAYCKLTYCGDGSTQSPNGYGDYEECDSSDTSLCSPDCKKTYCGDGSTQSPNGNGIWEECDSSDIDICDSSCQDIVQPICGDDDINQWWEECEPPDTSLCSPDCKKTYCGDGSTQCPNGNNVCEECEPRNTSICDSDCKTITYCGDGSVQCPNGNNVCEECEPRNTSICDSNCQNITSGGDGDGDNDRIY